MGHGNGAEFELQLSGLDAGELQQVFRQAGEARGVFADDLDEAAAVGGVLQCAGQKCFGETLDGGQGRAELVRYVGHEILADAFQASQVGDVMQHQNGSFVAGGLYWRGRDGEASRPDGAHGDFAGHLLLTA